MNILTEYLQNKGLWEKLSPAIKGWVTSLTKGEEDDILIVQVINYCEDHPEETIETLQMLFEDDQETFIQDSKALPFEVPTVVAQPAQERKDGFTWVALGILTLVAVVLYFFGGNIEKQFGIVIPWDTMAWTGSTLVSPPVEKVEPAVAIIINGELTCNNGQLITFDNGMPNWLVEDDGGKVQVGPQLPALTNSVQGFCISDLDTWNRFIGNSTNRSLLATRICDKTAGGKNSKCVKAIQEALLSASPIETTVKEGDTAMAYDMQAGVLYLPAMKRGVVPSYSSASSPNQLQRPAKSATPTPTGTILPDQTPTLSPTPGDRLEASTSTPDTVAKALAVELGEAENGPQELAAVDMDDLISRTADVWELPGIDSVEIRLSESGLTSTWIAWAPSFKEAEYYFWVWETDSLYYWANKSNCSGFVLDGALIYELKVANYPTFVVNDSAGIAKYMFPANMTSVYGCIIWPISTPAPADTSIPTQVPDEPTYTPQPTPTATYYVDHYNVSISWSSLVGNPGQVSGSGNSFLTKQTTQDAGNSIWVGNVTGGSILYNITNIPSTIDGNSWNMLLISLTGQQYGDNGGECNVPDTNIWVANCW